MRCERETDLNDTNKNKYRTTRDTLVKAGWDMNGGITHCCPNRIQDTFSGRLSL